jgi:hypothetical protein
MVKKGESNTDPSDDRESIQNDRHDTIAPIPMQLVVTGAGLFSKNAPRFSSSMPDAGSPPVLPLAHALSNGATVTSAMSVLVRIMRTSVGEDRTT